ncbi:MAG: hypothetical protein C4B58_16645 [Deltaproteobacteria bacterium]|nr:MAG: hypothetical protein C4B58_16645 [Deltaproteobacteria bacterium]
MLECNQSWVARRLVLIDVLSDEILDLVRKGHISSWAAARILAPMARAIPDHAHILAERLAKDPQTHGPTDTDTPENRRGSSGNSARKRSPCRNPGLFGTAEYCGGP